MSATASRRYSRPVKLEVDVMTTRAITDTNLMDFVAALLIQNLQGIARVISVKLAHNRQPPIPPPHGTNPPNAF